MLKEWNMSGTVRLSLALLIACGLLLGCTPRVVVRANPTRHDTGIRYYRPKPYLKVEPAEVAVDRNKTEIIPQLVKISLVYLPDFAEEYSIDVRSGFGTADVGIKLEDGWNLTEISQDLDSQTDENLEALGSLLSAVGDIVPTSTNAQAELSMTAQASNVPIGFYESILGRDARGCKRLYGFRYIGFVPFSNCPTDMGGSAQACCHDPLSGLYGLTFSQGQMVFARLDDMASGRVAAASKTGMAAPSAGAGESLARDAQSQFPAAQVPPPVAAQAPDAEQLALRLRGYLGSLGVDVGGVQAVADADGVLRVDVQVGGMSSQPELRAAIEEWLGENTSGRVQVQLMEKR